MAATTNTGRLPDFLLIGAMKCGTTSLCHYLAQHPRIYLPADKEPHFFALNTEYAKGLSHYRQLFADAAADQLSGEGSTGYTKQHQYPDAAARIAQALPDARLLYIVRHPLDQMRSHWRHLALVFDEEPGDFDTCVREYPNFLDICDYGKQLAVYREHYPQHQILVLFNADLAADPLPTLTRCWDFLGLGEPDIPIDLNAQNVTASRSMGSGLRHALQRIPGVPELSSHAPQALKQAFAPALYRHAPQPGFLASETRKLLRDTYVPRWRAFLAEHGKGPDHWDFAQDLDADL